MQTILAGNVRLAVEDNGMSTSRAPLLLVHGFPLDHTMWQAQIDYFGRRGRVIAPDLRGFGESAGSVDRDDPRTSYLMDDFADDLLAMLDALAVRGPVVFCGLSMGGYIGWRFWRRYRERMLALVVCDSPALADTRQAALGRAELARRVLTDGAEPVVSAMVPKLFGRKTIAEQWPCIAQTEAAIRRASPKGVALALGGMALRPDSTELLATIRVPALVAVGEHDAISSVEEMRGIADQIPDAEFVVIPDAGHMSPLENPEAFNIALEKFLNEKAFWR